MKCAAEANLDAGPVSERSGDPTIQRSGDLTQARGPQTSHTAHASNNHNNSTPAHSPLACCSGGARCSLGAALRRAVPSAADATVHALSASGSRRMNAGGRGARPVSVSVRDVRVDQHARARGRGHARAPKLEIACRVADLRHDASSRPRCAPAPSRSGWGLNGRRTRPVSTAPAARFKNFISLSLGVGCAPFTRRHSGGARRGASPRRSCHRRRRRSQSPRARPTPAPRSVHTTCRRGRTGVSWGHSARLRQLWWHSRATRTCRARAACPR